MCVNPASILNMATQTVPLSLRVSEKLRDRVDALSRRYDTSMNAVAKIALVIGLEAMERLQGDLPDETAQDGEEGDPLMKWLAEN